jgi:hypothetical protein
MKKTFNQLHNLVNDTDCYTKNILAKLYLYKHKIVATNRKFVIMENQTHISKLKRKKIPYIKLKRSLIGFNLKSEYYVFKHEKNSLLSFEIPYIRKKISINKTDFNSICYKLYTMNTIKKKHLMLCIKAIKGGFLALSGNIFGFIPKAQAVHISFEKIAKHNLALFKELLKPTKYFLKWSKIQIGKATIKTRLKVQNFKRKRRLSRSRMFLKNISFVFIFDSIRHAQQTTTNSIRSSIRRLSKEVSEILKFNKPIWSKSRLKRIMGIIHKHTRNPMGRKHSMRLCLKLIKRVNGKSIKKKKKVAEFNTIRGRKRNERLLRFLFR